MLSINFFENRINIQINIHRGGHIEVTYKGQTLVSGIRESCFNRLKSIVEELQNLGNKEVYFYIQNMTVGDSTFRFDVIYFKEHLSVLKSQAKCYIEIKSGLYDTFA